MTFNTEFKMNNSDSINNDEIDIPLIFNLLSRKKKLISQISFLGVIFGVIFSLLSEKIWEGNFEIVLSEKGEKIQGASLDLPGSLTPFLNLTGGGGDFLKTEVGILESPLVLKKVFNYVKEKKSPDFDEITFKKWKKQYLKIDLGKETSILNLSYRDNDKELVLAVLKNISKSYQDYSGRKKRREMILGKQFFEDQIDIYKEKSKNSLKETQSFALEYNLSTINRQSKEDEEISPDVINVEFLRIQSANNIKRIETQLEELKKLNDPQQIIYYSGITFGSQPNSEDSPNNQLVNELSDIQKKISFNKLIYKSNDKLIMDLIMRRDITKKALKQQLVDFLLANKSAEEAILKASQRPEGVLVKYRQLLDDSKRNAAVLNNLELQYRALLLEEAKTEDPWELITEPTLLNYPVYPNKKLIVFYSFLTSFLFGSLISIVLEKKKNTLLNSKEVASQINYPLLIELSTKKQDKLNDSLGFLFKSSYFKNQKDISFLIFNKIEKSLKIKLENILKKGGHKLQTIDEYINGNNSTKVVLMPVYGETEKSEILNNIKNLKLIETDVLGIVPIKDISNKDVEADLIKALLISFNFLRVRVNSINKNFKDKLNKNYIRKKISYYLKYLDKNDI